MGRTSGPGDPPAFRLGIGARRGAVVGALLLALLGGCTRAREADRQASEAYPELQRLDPEAVPWRIEAETRFIDFGSPAAREHLVSGWSGDERSAAGGVTYVWSVGSSSSLRFTVLEPRTLRLTARVMPLSFPGAEAQHIRLAVNSRPAGRLTLEPGLREYSLTLPGPALVRGSNLLTFHYRYTAAPREVLPDSPDRRRLAVSWDRLGIGTEAPPPPPLSPEVSPRGLFLPFGAGLSFYRRLPGDGVLTLQGLELRGASRGRIRISLEPDGAPERVLGVFSRPAEGLALPFRAPAGRLARISLDAVVADPSPGDGGWAVVGPALRLRPPAPRRPPAGGPAGELPEGTRPNILIYLVDTLRADHLGCYGYPRPTSPGLDAFAGDAVLFENALAQSSWTRTAVASLFTGLDPPAHAVLDRGDALSGEAVTLAELLRGAGYVTAALVTNGNVAAGYGFAQGFETFRLLGEREGESLHTLSSDVNREARRWLESPRDGPFFLYLHTMDPHVPYAPPEETAGRFARQVEAPRLGPGARRALEDLRRRWARLHGGRGGGAELGSVAWMKLLAAAAVPATPKMVRDLAALYDEEVLFNDASFTRLVWFLKQRGLYQDTLIVFLADHGEEFREHGGWEHGTSLYQEQVRIPLLVKLPAGLGERGVRRAAVARQTDLLPTILDLLGLGAPAGLAGRSLVPALLGGGAAGGPRGGPAVLDLDGREAAAWLEPPWKLMCERAPASRCRLFHLGADPGERVDLRWRRRVVAGYLQARIEGLAAPGRRLEAAPPRVDRRTRRHLQALGYLP